MKILKKIIQNLYLYLFSSNSKGIYLFVKEFDILIPIYMYSLPSKGLDLKTKKLRPKKVEQSLVLQEF